MTPYDHALLSVRDFGGKVQDYLNIHKFLDSSKFHVADSRHRALFHNSFGMDLCEKLFGDITPNGISVREVARRHIIQDCGKVPTVKECLDALCNNDIYKYNKPNRSDLEYLKKLKDSDDFLVDFLNNSENKPLIRC